MGEATIDNKPVHTQGCFSVDIVYNWRLEELNPITFQFFCATIECEYIEYIIGNILVNVIY